MKITLAAVGAIHVPGLETAQQHWLQLARHRMRPWATVEVLELPHRKSGTSQESEQDWWKRVSKIFSSGGTLHLTRLDEDGKELPSREWAQTLRGKRDQSIAHWVLLIGDADGWGEWMRSQIPDALSLGKQTLAHDLARVVLAEQIFRAAAILTHHPYHREGTLHARKRS